MSGNMSRTSSSGDEITITCLFLGHSPSKAFAIDIRNSKAISSLKQEIAKKRPDLIGNIIPDELDLFYGNICTVQETDKQGKIKYKSDNQITAAIQEFMKTNPEPERGFMELDTFLPLGVKCIHFVFRIPDNAPVSHAMVKDGSGPSSGASGSKHSHSGDIDMGMEPFPLGMRRRREEDPEEERPRKLQTRLPAPSAGGAPDIFRQWALPGSDQTLQQKISSIHEAIKLIDPNLDFSNPCVLTNLPFPSTLRMPEERFKAIDDDKNLHNVIKFPYMGRLKFSELLAAVQRGPFTRGEKLYLYGASGTGKSHMLAAFVCKLVREGKRVVYIPDCRELLENFVDAVREALLFAFYDDLCSWDIIFNARTTSHLQQFLNGRPKHSLYFIIDQRNALDQHNPDLQQKIDVSCSLRCMAYGQLYIFSASANEESSRDADHKQSGINTIYFCAGMTEDETDAWFAHHATSLPNLSQLNRNFVKYITGNIPLLLQPLFEYKDEEFDDTKFLQSTELATVANNIKSFYNGIFTANSKTAEERDLCLRGMMACLMQTSFSIDKKFYDLRYFYFNQGTSIGHSTCGIASQVLMALYRRHNLERLDINRFYSTISASSNPIVRGYLAEHVCLDAIKRHGLPCIDSTLNRPLDAEFFDDVPNWNPFIASTHECRLYLPATFNFANVDAAILRLDRWNRKAYLYPIQVTLARTHKDSETKFYEEQWKNWTEGLSDYEVYSTFVWIDQQQPSNGAIEMVARPTRNGIKEVIPQHNFSHVSIKSVDEKLSQKLEERPL